MEVDYIICRKANEKKKSNECLYSEIYTEGFSFVWEDWFNDLVWPGTKRGFFLFFDTDKHFREAKIISFYIIWRECRGEEVPKDPLQYYQTVKDKSVSEYPASDQEKILLSAFRTDRKDIFFEQKSIN